MKLIVSQAAAADLARLHEFLADKNQIAAHRAVAALIAAVQSHLARPRGTGLS
jgi:plasmid stabilization system protein ParE